VPTVQGPKYNPTNKRFRLQDWQSVIQTVRQYARSAKLDAVESWARETELAGYPNKADQDRLDSILCAIVGYHWRTKSREQSVMIGDLTSGYMIAPNHADMRLRLDRASAKHHVPCL
jgi:predicted RNase H-like nuclease